MPVVVKDFVWRDTEAIVTIHVPLHGVPRTRVDLLTTDYYIKASFERFFFEVFLNDEIDVEASKCTTKETEIIYELAKVTQIKWNILERQLNKEEKKSVRLEAVEKVANKLKEDSEKKANKKDVLKRCAVTEAIGIDAAQRNDINRIRNEEKSNALGDLKEWKQKVTKKIKAPTFKPPIKPRVPIEPAKTEKNIPIPLPRSKCTLSVDFTPRVLPTPCRESQEAEETEWLTKQAEARRSVGFVSEDLRPEEKNPQYLLAKGDEFFRNSNFLGAISAYSFGIRMSPKFVDLYIRRSEVHQRIGNFNKCITDCSAALDLLKPAVDANLEQRAICIGRRGIALDKAGMRPQAIDELRASLRLKPMKEFGQYHDKILYEPNSED